MEKPENYVAFQLLLFLDQNLFYAVALLIQKFSPLKYLIDKAMFNQIIGKQVICKVAVKTHWLDLKWKVIGKGLEGCPEGEN